MRGIKKNRFFLLFLLLLALFLGANFVLAQGRELEVEYPQILGEAPATTQTLLPNYVKYIFNLSLTVAGFLAFVMLVYGGFRYLTSAGSPAKMKDARDRIFAALLGLIILFSAYLILTTINPQLVILSIPEIIKYEPPPIIEPVPLEQQTLSAQEIPTGKLIDGTSDEYEGILAKTRVERIIKLSEEVWNTSKKIQGISKEISDASQRLEELSQQCVCGSGGGCAYNCGGCPCNCKCNGDPCGGPIYDEWGRQVSTVRDEIRKQQAILSTKPAELLPLKQSLENLSAGLGLEKEKLGNALAELQKAEKLMKECPLSVSDGGKSMALLNSASFWLYKEASEGQKMVKEIEINKLWENIYAEDDETTFYCTETAFEASTLKGFSGEELEEFSKIEGIEEPKTLCGAEIPIGSIIDNSEDIGQKLIDEMQKIRDKIPIITNEIPKEVENATNLSVLPDCHNCSDWCRCTCIAKMCCSIDGGCHCCGCLLVQSCQGSPCPEDKKKIGELNALIQKNHQIITDAYNNVTVSDDEVHNLINGNEVHDSAKIASPPPSGMRISTWAYNIINNELPATRVKFGRCANSEADWLKMMSGEEILTKNIITCEEAKTVCWDIEEGHECHGQGDPESYTDYFCAEASQY